MSESTEWTELDESNFQCTASECLDAMCLVSKIATWLYPDLVMGKDREAKFFDEGGAFALQIAAAAERHLRIYRAHQAKLEARRPPKYGNWQNRFKEVAQ